jgi:Uma2 family endonuclease
MPPSPNREHQDLESCVELYLRRRWAAAGKGKVYHQINVASRGGWPSKNYRIPDVVLLTPQRYSIDRNEYFDGAPDVVVEIHSPGDEAYEKLDFYAEIGVPEVWILHRDSKRIEVRSLKGSSYALREVGANGWVLSEATWIELRTEVPGKLSMRLAGDESTREDVPE